MNTNLTHQQNECTCDEGNIKNCPYCHQITKDGKQATCFNVACKDAEE